MKKTLKFDESSFKKSCTLRKDDQENNGKYPNHDTLLQARPSLCVNLIDTTIHQERIVTVQIRVIFLKLGIISILNSRYACEAFLEATWDDQNFFRSSNSKSLQYDTKRHWNPCLYVDNLVSSDQSQEIWYHIERTSPGTCRVSERRRVKGEFFQKFDLTHYPLDLQELAISVSSFRSAQELRLVSNRQKMSSVNVSSFTQTHEWTLDSNVCKSEKSTTAAAAVGDEETPSLSMNVCVQRKPHYYYWNVYLLSLIIAIVCLCCYSIRCDLASSRLIVSTTVLLTLVTFKWSVARNMPSVSYLTSLDKYSLLTIVVVYAQCVYYAIMGGVVTTPGCPEPFKSVDDGAFYASVSAYVLLNGVQVVMFARDTRRNASILEARRTACKETAQSFGAKRARIRSIFQQSMPDVVDDGEEEQEDARNHE